MKSIIAIDPTNPQNIYAGTWHFPGKRPMACELANIKQGIIDDSDVFSIIIDRKRDDKSLCQCLLRYLQERDVR